MGLIVIVPTFARWLGRCEPGLRLPVLNMSIAEGDIGSAIVPISQSKRSDGGGRKRADFVINGIKPIRRLRITGRSSILTDGDHIARCPHVSRLDLPRFNRGIRVGGNNLTWSKAQTESALRRGVGPGGIVTVAGWIAEIHPAGKPVAVVSARHDRAVPNHSASGVRTFLLSPFPNTKIRGQLEAETMERLRFTS